ncbi:MAG TPA: hypothetical protein VF613_04115 [Longimicrobium sp.]|jgi:hypothetical protein
MRLAPAALVLALAACGPAEGEAAAEAAAATPAATSAEAQDNGTFSILKGDTTMVTVRFQRTPARVQTEIFSDSAGELVTYTAELRPDATVARMQLRGFARRADAEPKARANIELRGDSAFVESVQNGETQRARTAAPAGLIPMPVGESLDMVEQVLRRARALGGGTAQIPVVALEGGARSGTATVTFMAADSARVQFRFEGSSNELIAATDATGRLLGGRVPRHGYVIRRDP